MAMEARVTDNLAIDYPPETPLSFLKERRNPPESLTDAGVSLKVASAKHLN